MNATSPKELYETTVFQWIGKTYHAATNEFESATGVTAARWRLLFIIDRRVNCTQKSLIAEVRVDPGSITRQLKMLEVEGLIHRENDPDDNRLTRVKLTPEGKNFVEKVYGTRAEFMARMLDGIPAENIPIIISGLRRMAENLGDKHPLP